MFSTVALRTVDSLLSQSSGAGDQPGTGEVLDIIRCHPKIQAAGVVCIPESYITPCLKVFFQSYEVTESCAPLLASNQSTQFVSRLGTKQPPQKDTNIHLASSGQKK